LDGGSLTGAEENGSVVLSIVGESMMAEPPSKTFCVFASSIVEREGFKTAGAIVGLLPTDGLRLTAPSALLCFNAL